MARLFYIEASPRGQASASSGVAVRLIDTLADFADLQVDHLNLWREDLPSFDGTALEAKYAVLSGVAHNHAQASAWQLIKELVQRIDLADAVLISTPMWNLSVPYRLKHWIDLVTQPGLSFTFSPESGYRPLLRNRPTVAVLASAGDYSEGRSFGREDLATPYLRAALAFIGLADLWTVAVGPTAGAGEAVAAGRRRAEDLAHRTAAKLAQAIG